MGDGSGEFASVDDATLISGDSIMGEAVSLARLGPGKRLGPYLILARLCVGEGGVHYRAWDTRSDSVVRLRLLRPERDQDQLREDLEGLAAIRHPKLAAILEVRIRYGIVCVAEDDVGSVSLGTWAEGRSWERVGASMRDVALALAAVHAAGEVYRELEPSAVHLDDEGRTTLGALRSQSERRTTSSSVYLAPECHAGQPAHAASDQFSFCVLLYEALYGERPFAARTVEGLVAQVEAGRLRPAPAGSCVPRWLRGVVVRGLAHDPAARWPSMDALAEALDCDAALGRRRKLGFGLALGLALCVGVVLGSLL